MKNEETPMGDDKRFVFRRGTQGNEWRAQTEESDPAPPVRGRLVSLHTAIRSARGWARARLKDLRSLMDRSSAHPAKRDVLPPTREEPGYGWAPMPQLPEDPRVAVPWSRVAPPSPKRPAFRERLVTNKPRVAAPLSKIALGRPKVRSVKPPKASVPKVHAPKVRALRMARISVPRPKVTAPHVPRVLAPRMPKMKTPIVTFSGLAGVRLFGVRDDLRAPLAVFFGLALASFIAFGAILAIETVGGDEDSALVITSASPKVTDAPRVTPVTTAVPTGKPSPTARPSATASAAAATATPAPFTAAPTPTAPVSVVPVSTPQGLVGVAYWSNKLNRWWFGDLSDAVATYEEGHDVPFLVRWEGTPGATYSLRIVFDCKSPGTSGALDYLSGVPNYSGSLATAQYGPGGETPAGAIPVPDIPNFDPDDGDSGVFWLWNAKFPVLPLPPHPGDNCDSQRTQDIAIQGLGGPIVFLASGHLGSATVYGSSEGASSAKSPFGLHVTVDGVAGADVMIHPSAVADFER